MYNKNLGYSAINTAKSAVSITVYTVSNVNFGNHILIKQFMKGIANSRPSLPRYNCTWDVKTVLTFLETLYPLDSLSLKLLTYKLATLMALCTGQRIQTLHSMQIQYIELTSEYMKIRIRKLLKQSKPGKHLPEIYIEKYPLDSLCVVNTMQFYLKQTENKRNHSGGLFIGINKPHNPVTKATLAKWIKKTLAISGIDMNMFCPHSIRGASTSALVGRIPIETILRTAGWTKDCTFRKFYNRPITNNSDFSNSMLDIHVD